MRTRRKWTVLGVVAGLIVAAVGGYFVPQAIRSRSGTRAKSCSEYLIKIDAAKAAYQSRIQKSPGDLVEWKDIDPRDPGYTGPVLPEIGRFDRKCPSTGQKYLLNPIGVEPQCLSGIEGHSVRPWDWPSTGQGGGTAPEWPKGQEVGRAVSDVE